MTGKNSWQDKITSKIRDCLSSTISNSQQPAPGFSNCSSFADQYSNSNMPMSDLEDTIDDSTSLDWHTPCEEEPLNLGPAMVQSPVNSCNGPRVYRAKFSYEATCEDELSMKTGDVVVLLQQNTKDRGWWLGEHQPSGKTGLFPCNYAEPFTRSASKVTKKVSSTTTTSSEMIKDPHRRRRITVLEQEIASLKAKIDSKPSFEQMKTLEDEVERLKRAATAFGSPAFSISSPVCGGRMESPLSVPCMNHQSIPTPKATTPVLPVKYAPDVNSNKENYATLPKAASDIPKNSRDDNYCLPSKPGQVKVPACFSASNSPVGPMSQSFTTKRSPATGFKPASVAAPCRDSMSPASIRIMAVRVNAVATPELTTMEDLEQTTPSILHNRKSVQRNPSIVAANKLKRRSVAHYSKKCEKKFSKLCNFYETFAESKRLGFAPERTECSSTSPSSFSTSTAEFSIVSEESSRASGKDNPFNSKSFETSGISKLPTKENQNMRPMSPSKKKSAVKPKMGSNALQHNTGKQSPSLMNIRRPPANKIKTNQSSTFTTPQRSHKTKVQSVPGSCPQPQSKNGEQRESVTDLCKRFETITTRSAVTNALNCQPSHKRSRTAMSANCTPTSAGKTRQVSRNRGMFL